jgi:hypothetical protein
MKKFIIILLGIILFLAMITIPATISEWFGWAYGWR